MKIAIDIGHPVIEKPNNFFNGRAIFLQTGTGISSPVRRIEGNIADISRAIEILPRHSARYPGTGGWKNCSYSARRERRNILNAPLTSYILPTSFDISIIFSQFANRRIVIVRNYEQIGLSNRTPDFYSVSFVKSMEVGEEIQKDGRRNMERKNF